MPTSDNDTRTPKNPKKRAAAASTDPGARRRTTKKTADAPMTAAAPMTAKTTPAAATAQTTPAAVTAPKSQPAPAMSAAATPRPAPVLTGARPDPAIAKVVDADERRRMIGEAAYHKFLQRGPGNGTPAQDWCEAESEIDALLGEHQPPHAQ